MSISIYPVMPDFAAEIGDVDLSKPLSPADESAAEFEEDEFEEDDQTDAAAEGSETDQA